MKSHRHPSLPLRRIGTLVGGGTPTSDSENWNGSVPFVTPPDLRPVTGGLVEKTDRWLTEEGAAAGSSVIPADSVLLSIRAPIGYVARTGMRAAFNQGCRAIVPCGSVSSRYLTYALVAAGPELDSLGRGTTFMELSATQMAALEVPVPLLEEQRAIADHLDRETARIDTLIDEQQRLVEMLRERRQALIESSMFESSDAPIRLSRIASSRSGDVPPPLEEDGQCAVWGAGRLVGHTSQANAQAGDLLVGRVGQGSVGKVRRLTESAWATDNTIVLRLDLSASDPRYIEHCLRLIPRFELVGGGAMPLVTAERLLAQSVPFTTLIRQQVTADHLDEQNAKIDTLIAETERFIELSKEHRSALITAAVTGQIDVREMV